MQIERASYINLLT